MFPRLAAEDATAAAFATSPVNAGLGCRGVVNY
jgi:hypothetical protein